MLLNHNSLAIQDSEVVAAALVSFREYAGVEFSDCLALETARRAGHLPFGTFDRRFSRDLQGAHPHGRVVWPEAKAYTLAP